MLVSMFLIKTGLTTDNSLLAFGPFCGGRGNFRLTFLQNLYQSESLMRSWQNPDIGYIWDFISFYDNFAHIDLLQRKKQPNANPWAKFKYKIQVQNRGKNGLSVTGSEQSDDDLDTLKGTFHHVTHIEQPEVSEDRSRSASLLQDPPPPKDECVLVELEEQTNFEGDVEDADEYAEEEIGRDYHIVFHFR